MVFFTARLTTCTLLAVIVIKSAILGISGSQIHFNASSDTHHYEAPSYPSKPNLVDLLAASPNHVIYVRLLQRTRLVPTLMNLLEYGDGRGLTIIAPTDDAIKRRIESDRASRIALLSASDSAEQGRSIWEWASIIVEDGDESPSDDTQATLWIDGKMQLGNVNAVLRQQLLYHMVNYTLPYQFSPDGRINSSSENDRLSSGKVEMLSTLHRPSRRLLHEPTRPGPIPHPPSTPPHPGAEDDGGLLAAEGQKMRIATQGKEGDVWVGTDATGSGSVKIVGADASSSTGLLLSIDGIVDIPPSLANLLKTNPVLQHLHNLTTSTLLSSLTEAAHSTFFLPTEKAFEALSAVEMTFITGDWELAKQDRLKLLGEHMSGIGMGQGKIAYAQRLRDNKATNLTTIFGGQISIEVDKEGKLLVEGSNIIEEDVLIENGVVHVVDSLLLPFGDLNLSVEKTLLALNASRFVSLMHSAGLEGYINASPHDADDPDHTAKPWTFLVPRDDVIDQWLEDQQATYSSPRSTRWREPKQDSSMSDMISISKPNLVEILKYHIAPDQIKSSNLTAGMLIETELQDQKLKNARQKIIADVQSPDDNKSGESEIGFGDAYVVASPILVGPSIIYLISQMLAPPSNALQIAVSSLSLSTFVAAVFSAELDRGIKETPAITYLVPHNDAFASLGLAMQYLLLDQMRSRNDLRSVIEYHAIDEIVYMKDFTSSSKEYPTLEGSPIWAERVDNKTVAIRRGTTGRDAKIIKSDLLTSTGVLHEIDQVELPPTLDLTIEKLMRGAKVEIMKEMVQQAGYGWILNASRPSLGTDDDQESEEAVGKFPHKHKKDKKKQHRKRHQLLGSRNQSYIILCPTDAAFNRVNLTFYYSQPEALKALVQLHIIPAPADQVLPDGKADQLPISIKDASSFTTLLDSSVGGVSKFGKVAFRKYKAKKNKDEKQSLRMKPEDPDETNLGFVVGVADTRGTDGRLYSANVLSFGRESLAANRDSQEEFYSFTKKKDGNDGGQDWNSKAIGGILTIDNVLQPYEPNWFYRWGWIALSSILVAIILASIGYGVWTWLHKDGRIRLPEALEGEEE